MAGTYSDTGDRSRALARNPRLWDLGSHRGHCAGSATLRGSGIAMANPRESVSSNESENGCKSACAMNGCENATSSGCCTSETWSCRSARICCGYGCEFASF